MVGKACLHAGQAFFSYQLSLPWPPGFFLLFGGSAGFEGDEVLCVSGGGVVAVCRFGDDGLNSGIVEASFDVEVADPMGASSPTMGISIVSSPRTG